MTSLLDIAGKSDTVHGVNVNGISIADITALLKTFPELQKALAGRSLSGEVLMELVPGAVPHIIAAGVGEAGNEKFIAHAATMGLEFQIDFVSKIVELTMPGGVGPFMEKLNKVLGKHLGSVEASAEAPATKSPKQPKP